MGAAIGLVIGFYDGFFGPGTGTFLIISYALLLKYDFVRANGNTKVANLSSNIASLATFLVFQFALAVPAAIFGIAGNLIGSRFVVRNGVKIIRPVFFIAIGILFAKIAFDAIAKGMVHPLKPPGGTSCAASQNSVPMRPEIGEKGKMRDTRFVAEHRGGPLKKNEHHALMIWACDCAAHVLDLWGEKPDQRLVNALETAKEWTRGHASVGDARKASVEAIAAAHEMSCPKAVAVARCVGHAVATAHMADHSLGAAWYALKAAESAGRSTDAERKWQDKRLPSGIRELVLAARKSRKFDTFSRRAADRKEAR